MQQMQLWIFWAIAAGIHNLRLHPHAETKKKATNGNLAASGAEQHVPVLTTSHDQLAVLTLSMPFPLRPALAKDDPLRLRQAVLSFHRREFLLSRLHPRPHTTR
jgi:hypothetical protein